MKNPFRVGDKVYTPEGEFFVGAVEESGCYIGKDTDYKGHNSRWTPTFMISFKPWPKPEHQRPIQDGWWIVSVGDDEPAIRQVAGTRIYRTNGRQMFTSIDRYTFHRYLGKDWK